ncbi:MAG: hypothetical protein EOO60_12215 [Hymenobacter sp.]|nr:MAG: hypothetical protein EOO60_12215 [Hymenobacter sp.]
MLPATGLLIDAAPRLKMTADEFLSFWPTVAATDRPVAYLFRQKFRERWFRIHSLPESKRYASTAAEWQLLLQRHYTLLEDLLGNEKQILLITGYYTQADDEQNIILQDFILRENAFDGLLFTALPAVDVYALSPDIYWPGTHYWPLLAELTMAAPQLEPILRAIADDTSSAFFIGQHSRILVAPYDGGVDIILPNTLIRDQYRHKYRAWLSAREDGL